MNKTTLHIDIPDNVRQIVFCADIHGDSNALYALMQQYPDSPIICAGDVVDMFGNQPNSTLGYNNAVLKMVLSRRIQSVYGNHELELLKRKGYLSLDSENQEYLKSMPFEITIYYLDLKIRVFHATPASAYEYLSEEADLYESSFKMFIDETIIVGHTHRSYKTLCRSSHTTIVNPGMLADDSLSHAIMTSNGEINLISKIQ